MDSDVINLNRTAEQNFTVSLGDAALTFGKLGINQITHPVTLRNRSGTSNITTDWISPYIAGLMVDGAQSGNAKAVSGNHGTSGGGGHATANNKSTTIKVDGKAIGNNFNGTANKVEVTIVNEVTTVENIDLNSGERASVDFEETLIYVFERNHMRIYKLELNALVPMYINWYMGPQMTSLYNDSIYFTYDEEKTGVYSDTTVRRNSGTKGNSPEMTRVSMINGSSDLVHVYVDKDYGVGYGNITDNDVIAYKNTGTGKFYYHLVKSGNALEFNQGDKKSYRGGYIFSKNYGKNAYVTKFIEDGVQKAFVDFRQTATEQIEYTSIEESVNVTGNGTSLTASTNNAYAKVVI